MAEVDQSNTSRIMSRDACNDADRDASREIDTDADRDANKKSDNEACNDADRDADRDAERDNGRDVDKNADNEAFRDANRDASNLDILYTNAQSLVNKIEELRAIMAINNPDILIITGMDKQLNFERLPRHLRLQRHQKKGPKRHGQRTRRRHYRLC